MTTFKWYGDKVKKAVSEAGNRGLGQAAQDLLEKANQTVPRETGRLADSGDTSVKDGTMSVYYTADYAIFVHEASPDTQFFGSGRRKWLELTAREMGEDLADTVADHIREEMN